MGATCLIPSARTRVSFDLSQSGEDGLRRASLASLPELKFREWPERIGGAGNQPRMGDRMMCTPRHRTFYAALFFCAWIAASVSPGTVRAASQIPPAHLLQLSGHVLPEFLKAPLVGNLATSTQLQISIGLPVQNASGLAAFLAAVTDPASPQFRHYLTPAQFDQQYGPTAQDYETVKSFAQANGLRITNTYPSRLLLGVSANVDSIQRAFHVVLNTRRRSDGSIFYAPDREPSLTIAAPVSFIGGLDNFSPPRRASNGTGPNGSFTEYDLRNAYASNVPEMGEGQTVGIFESDGFFTAGPVAYEQRFNLSVPILVVLTPGEGFSRGTAESGPNNGAPATSSDAEVAGDIQMAMALAPKLSNVIVYEGSSTDQTLLNIATQQPNLPLPHQVSASYTLGTDAQTNVIFQKMAAQGQTMLAAAGDGRAVCAAIDGNLSNRTQAVPFVTVVGGSLLSLNQTQTGWGPETAAVAGGGIMTGAPIPAYQVGLATQANQGSAQFRNMPDLAMNYNNNFDMDSSANANGTISAPQPSGFSGTSASTPLMAGYIALANERLNNNPQTQGQYVGFINPAIYAIGRNPQAYALAFHDIQSGSNATSPPYCPGYSATPGYDLVTGWGTPNNQFINYLLQPNGNPPAIPTCFGQSPGYATVVVQCYSYASNGNVVFDSTDPMFLMRQDPATQFWVVADDGAGNSWDNPPPRHSTPYFQDNYWQSQPQLPGPVNYEVCARRGTATNCTATIPITLNTKVAPAGFGGVPACGPGSIPYKPCQVYQTPQTPR